jgi:hypothetical protein
MSEYLNEGDRNIVSNLRHKYGDRLTDYSDERIAHVYREWQQSEDYPDEEKLLDWMDDL